MRLTAREFCFSFQLASFTLGYSPICIGLLQAYSSCTRTDFHYVAATSFAVGKSVAAFGYVFRCAPYTNACSKQAPIVSCCRWKCC